jgi:hypothetical protein
MGIIHKGHERLGCALRFLCVRSQHCQTLLHAMPALRRLAVDVSTRRPSFDRIGLMEFVVDEVALGDFFCKFFDFHLSVSLH